MKTTAQLITLLEKKFPKAWFKEGEDFSSSYDTAVWTGEGSYIDKAETTQMFSYYNLSDDYQFGAHVKLCEFVEKHGYFVECYDGGTYFIFPQ